MREIDSMDSEAEIKSKLSEYRVIAYLESISKEEYHAFLYDLLNQFQGMSVPLNFLFDEILRYEPSVSPLIQILRQVLVILSSLRFLSYWGGFIKFSSEPPFSIQLDEQNFNAFLRENITIDSLLQLCKVCSLLSIPVSTAYHCFVFKTLFDSQSDPSRLGARFLL